jgi:putative spermidine/putrescine transport system permease protein
MRNTAPAFFLLFAVFPLAAGLAYALLYSLGLVGALAQGFTLSAWADALTDAAFWRSLGLSAGLAAAVLAISTALALGLLMTLRPQLEQPRVRFLLHFPLALPPMVAAFVSFQWLGSAGMLARLTGAGSPEAFPPLINDPLYLGVGLTLTLTTFPFLLLIFLNHYRAANLLQITDLAATLGASAGQVRRRVLAPVLLRRAAPTLLLYGVFLFGAYEVPLLLGRQSPAMISMFIHQKFSRFNLADLPVAYMATVVYALAVMSAVLFFFGKKKEAVP